MTLPIRARARSFAALALFCLATAWAPFAAAQQLSIADASIVEGNAGTKYMVFTINLSAASASPVRVDVATSDGTATAGSDYLAASTLGLRFPAGTTSRSIVVSILGDAAPESNETLKVDLSNAVGATISDAQGIGTIANDDIASGPTLSIADSRVSEGDSLNLNIEFTVSLSQPTDHTVFFDLATADGTASPNDYEGRSGRFFVRAGNTSETFGVLVNGDTQVEPDETFTVTLSNVDGADLADGVATATIVNDDGIGPQPTLTIGDVSLVEGNSGTKEATFTISLSAPAPAEVSFHLTTDYNSAMAGSDFVNVDLVGIIPAGSSGKDFAVTVNGDIDVESDEFFVVNITQIVGALVGDVQAIGTIVNDDANPVFISVGDASVTEGDDGTKVMNFTVSLSAPLPTNVNYMAFTSDQTTHSNIDYVALSESFVMPAGETSQTVAITLNGDIEPEEDETFAILLGNVYGNATVGDGQGIGTILDDDYANAPSLSIGDASISEGSSGWKTLTFPVTLSKVAASPVCFGLNVASGTATASSDYVDTGANVCLQAGMSGMSFDVSIIGDMAVEPDETFTVTAVNVTGANVADGEAIGTITNDDTPAPSLSIADVSVTEGNSGTKLATFTIALSAPASGAVTYDIGTWDGSATAGSDYVANSAGVQSIPEGSTSKTFSVTINGDTAVEANETFNVGVSGVVGANVIDGSAVGTITDDDRTSSLPTLSITDGRVSEGNSGNQNVEFVVSLSEPTDHIVFFDFVTADGTASSSDYDGRSERFGIAAGNTSQTFGVLVNGDTQIEPDETFTVTLSNAEGAELADGIATATIVNDDGIGPQPTLTIGDVSLYEGNAGTKDATFKVSLSAPAPADVSFHLTTDAVSATAGSDFVNVDIVGIIPAGSSGKDFAVIVNGDTDVEPDEFFVVNITQIVGALVGDVQARGTIINDDGLFGPTLSVSDATVVEGDSGDASLYFVVSMPEPSTGTVSFTLKSTPLSATSPDDFTATTITQSISPGDTIAWVELPVVHGDSAVEGVESFLVELSDINGAQPGDVQGIGRIVNDDGTLLASVVGDPNRVAAEFDSRNASMSPDGRFIAFESDADDMVAPCMPPDCFGDTKPDVYLRDMEAGVNKLASVATDGGRPNDLSRNPTVSADGRYVAFESWATNLVPSDDPGYRPDVFVRDMQTNATTKVSVGFDGSPANEASGDAAISADGRYVAFTSLASNLVTGVSGPDQYRVYVRDLLLGTTRLIGATGSGTPAGAPSISTDGSVVAFDSYLALTPADTDSSSDVFFFYSWNGSLALASVNEAGLWADGWASGASLSADGLRVAFLAGHLLGNGQVEANVFVRDVGQNVTHLVARAADGVSTPNSNFTRDPVISPDGKRVAFASEATNLIVNDTNNDEDIFVRDLASGTTRRANEEIMSRFRNFGARRPMLSNDASLVAFESDNANMVVDDTFGRFNIFRAAVPAPPSVPSLSMDDANVSEGNSGTKLLIFTVRLSAPSTTPVAFDVFSEDDSATAGSDYSAISLTGQFIPAGQTSKTVTVTIYGDTVYEDNERFILRVRNVSGATVDFSGAAGTIIDDDAPVLSIADMSISEGNFGTKAATFTVLLSAPAPSTVSFGIETANGTAIAGSDYVAASLSGQTIAVGQTSKTFSVTINGDATVEPDETFTVNVNSVVGAAVADDQAIGTITNDDGGGTPTLSIGDVSITEGNGTSKQATFTVTLSAAASTAVTYNIATANGTAVAPGDYTTKSLTGQSIPAGTLSKAFTVVIKGGTVNEPDETFLVNVSNVAGATAGDVQAVGTITNDDAAATPTLSIADASVIEGNSGTKILTFTVSLSPAASGTVSYNIATANGTATSGSDYVAASLSGQTISAGGTSKTFAVTINGDTTTEANETFTVTLSNVSGATLGDGGATGTISNDDGGSGPTLSIGDVTIAEGNSLSRQATFTVTLSAAATGPVTYNIATANGTAVSGSDYVLKSLSGQSIPAGSLSRTFSVGIKGDTVPEPNETFTVNVSSVVGATVADGQATGTISNDDAGVLSVARFDSRGLYDDVDDGNRGPVLTNKEYATLLLDTATTLCARTNAATVVAVDAVENPAALRDLADAANALCAGTPRYQMVMGEGSSLGFLVEATSATDARGVQVLEAPSVDAKSGLTTLTVHGSGHERPLTLLMPAALPANAAARNAQLKALAQRVRAERKADPEARLVLIGGVTVPGLLDLTAREWAKTGSRSEPLPGERMLVSQPLLVEFGATRIEFAAPAANELPTQVLQLKR
jgi:hypothetical protein